LLGAAIHLECITLRAKYAWIFGLVVKTDGSLFKEMRTLHVHVQHVNENDVPWLTSRLAGSVELHIGGGTPSRCICIFALEGFISELKSVMLAGQGGQRICRTIQITVSGPLDKSLFRNATLDGLANAAAGVPGLLLSFAPDAHIVP
jgi:hypothetical protein